MNKLFDFISFVPFMISYYTRKLFSKCFLGHRWANFEKNNKIRLLLHHFEENLYYFQSKIKTNNTVLSLRCVNSCSAHYWIKSAQPGSKACKKVGSSADILEKPDLCIDQKYRLNRTLIQTLSSDRKKVISKLSNS